MDQALPNAYDMLKLADPLSEKGWNIKYIDYMAQFKISRVKGHGTMIYDIMLMPEQFYEIFLKDGGHKKKPGTIPKEHHQYTLQDMVLDKIFKVGDDYYAPLSIGSMFVGGEFFPNRHQAIVAHISVEDFTVCNMEFHPHNIY